MKLQNRIIIYFSSAFIVVLGIALLGIYLLMSINREQEFMLRLKDKTSTTYKLLIEVKEIDHDILQTLDRNTINNLYDEKILLFDSAGTNIYSSVDDIKILFPLEIIKQLKQGEEDIAYREGDYEVYAHVIDDNGKRFYAIGKAYDKYGREKLNFLGWALFFIYVVVLILVVIISIYISKQITNPILKLTLEVNNKNIDNLSRIHVPASRDEIASLSTGFNNMLARVEDAYTYQKNFIQHMSHELKTPIAILISNIERTLADENPERWKDSFEFQKNGLMQMASVINTLLDISKYETNPELLFTKNTRLDEVIFECIESLQLLYPNARFDLSIHDSFENAEDLTYFGNERMLHIAFFNLLKNATEYGDGNVVKIEIQKKEKAITVEIINDGPVIDLAEQAKLFHHFFRGHNSKNKAGIGLGLVMAHKIIQLHKS
ncbi:MAG TPA: HAMP domain-containing sensor histidine kinase, partial [Cyclobacteriaceae bacterium]|nr:HAMP domain-containing sensor histidine kinase [Cyclobacteriaceae bacterium]